MVTKDQNKKLTSIKCITNLKHNNPDKKLHCYNNADSNIPKVFQ